MLQHLPHEFGSGGAHKQLVKPSDMTSGRRVGASLPGGRVSLPSRVCNQNSIRRWGGAPRTMQECQGIGALAADAAPFGHNPIPLSWPHRLAVHANTRASLVEANGR